LNPNQLFMGSNHGAFTEPDQGPNDPISETGIFASYSLDGGTTWVPRVMAKDDVAPFNVSDDNDTTPAARLIGDVNITDSAGGSTNDVALGDLVTDASGVTYAINFGPALSRAQREASVTLVGDFGPLTNGAPTVTGIAFDQVPTGVDLVGLYVDTTTPAPPQPSPGPGQPPVPGQAVNTQMFRVKLT